MTRKMLIISNPGEIGEENYCEGVNKDIKNYIQFFTSALGGGWYESEITYLERPYPSEVDAELQTMKTADYSVVIFCGHGCSYKGETIIELRKGFDYRTSSFRASAGKRTVILDCCRVIAQEITTGLYELAHMNIQKRSMDKQKARRYYDEQLIKCAKGLVVMQACDIDETAGDDEKQGGYYSCSLIACAKDWGNQQNGFAKDCMSVVACHNVARSRVQSLSGGNQNPQIEKPRSMPYYPFAVIV